MKLFSMVVIPVKLLESEFLWYDCLICSGLVPACLNQPDWNVSFSRTNLLVVSCELVGARCDGRQEDQLVNLQPRHARIACKAFKR